MKNTFTLEIFSINDEKVFSINGKIIKSKLKEKEFDLKKWEELQEPSDWEFDE